MCVSHLKDMCVIKTSSLLEEEPFSSGKLNTQKQKKERKKKNKQTPFSFEFVYFAVYFIFTCSHSYDNDGLAPSIHNPHTHTHAHTHTHTHTHTHLTHTHSNTHTHTPSSYAGKNGIISSGTGSPQLAGTLRPAITKKPGKAIQLQLDSDSSPSLI